MEADRAPLKKPPGARDPSMMPILLPVRTRRQPRTNLGYQDDETLLRLRAREGARSFNRRVSS